MRTQRHRLTVGAKVQCRLYNTPEHKFYGPYFTAIVTDIWYKDINDKRYEVEVGGEAVWAGRQSQTTTRILHRKEIKRVLVNGIQGLNGEYRNE